ncbi:hypothetical protein NLG97_g1809 [Lecanicillium saksenae]|uniref:Uncharacterized protein n=1 Tax=Lecanicillium saksenae TaxID=468837 RepID=A0ACC1R4M0_9HYPO|nr:hypothetical protein NLG97_g1809 [Lecanicillium saksenae]
MTKAATDAKAAWTEEARVQSHLYAPHLRRHASSANLLRLLQYQLLLRIVAQLQRNGQSIKWDEINMPGRTAKSLTHQWAKIKAQVAELEKATGQPVTTPSKAKGKGAGAKRKAEVSSASSTTPEKKRTPLPGSSPAKKDESDEEI